MPSVENRIDEEFTFGPLGGNLFEIRFVLSLLTFALMRKHGVNFFDVLLSPVYFLTEKLSGNGTGDLRDVVVGEELSGVR